MKRPALLAIFLVTSVLLTSCGLGLNRESIDFGLNPTPLGFSYDIDPLTGAIEFIIPSHTLVFSSHSGALGATVQGYSIEFYDSSGNPLFPGDHVVNSQGALNVYVPPGIACAEPDPVRGCTFYSEGARFARGPEVLSPPSFLMPISIAAEDFEQLLFQGGANGAYGDVYLYGVNDNLVKFRSGPYQVAVQVPVGE